MGAGLGGCVCAFELSRTHDVTVVELGRSTADMEKRVVDLARPARTNPHVGSGLGGGTALWHNALIEIDDEVFQQHWPFPKSELDPWYELAYPLLGGTPKEVISPASEFLIGEYKKLGLPADLFQAQFIPSRRRNLWSSLGLSDRVRLVRGEATRFAASGARVQSITVKTANGEVEVAGDYFLIAGGGFGTPVLLEKLSEQISAPSLENSGRFYEDHPIGTIGRVQVAKPFYRFWNYSVPGGSLRALSVIRSDAAHFGFQLRPATLRLRDDRAERMGSIITKLRNEMWNPLHWIRLLTYWDDVLDILSMKFGVKVPTSHYTIFFQAGQHVSHERSIFSGEEAAGQQKTIFRKWLFSSENVAATQSAVESFVARISPMSRSVSLLPDWQDVLASGAHHSGTARMSRDPESGVCDGNGKVHGVENVYIADGSAIPASGIANTGLTIAALSLRLSDHIQRRIGSVEMRPQVHVADPAADTGRPKLVLVTGGTGFIGSRFCARLQWAGTQKIRLLARSAAKASAVAGPFVEVVEGDLLQPHSIANALKGCDAVVHLAHADNEIAPKATRNLVRAAAQAGIKRFVHISSMAVHGPDPGPEAAHEATATIGRYNSAYSDSKAEEEEIVRQAMNSGDLQAVILRPTVVYGPGGPFVEAVLREARNGRVSLIDEGRGVCNAVFVDDVCDAIDAALTSPDAVGSAVFINGDHAITWRQFALGIASLVDPAPAIENISSSEALEWWDKNAPPPEKVPRTLPGKVVRKVIRMLRPKPAPAPPPYPQVGRIKREAFRVEFANAEAKRLLKWSPKVDFAAGVERIRESLQDAAVSSDA